MLLFALCEHFLPEPDLSKIVIQENTALNKKDDDRPRTRSQSRRTSAVQQHDDDDVDLAKRVRYSCVHVIIIHRNVSCMSLLYLHLE